MPRPRLIAIAAFQSEPDRILGCFSEADLAMDAILSAHVPAPAGGQLFFEEPDNAYPKMIQARFALNGEARHLGRIMVDRGSVDTVLAELRRVRALADTTPTQAAIAELKSAFDAYLRQLDRADVGVSVDECEAGIHVDICCRGYRMFSHLTPSGGVIGPIAPSDALYFVHDCLLLLDQQLLVVSPPRKLNKKRIRDRVDARLNAIFAPPHKGDPG